MYIACPHGHLRKPHGKEKREIMMAMVGPITKTELYLGGNISHFVLDMLILNCMADNLAEVLGWPLVLLFGV